MSGELTGWFEVVAKAKWDNVNLEDWWHTAATRVTVKAAIADKADLIDGYNAQEPTAIGHAKLLRMAFTFDNKAFDLLPSRVYEAWFKIHGEWDIEVPPPPIISWWAYSHKANSDTWPQAIEVYCNFTPAADRNGYTDDMIIEQVRNTDVLMPQDAAGWSGSLDDVTEAVQGGTYRSVRSRPGRNGVWTKPFFVDHEIGQRWTAIFNVNASSDNMTLAKDRPSEVLAGLFPGSHPEPVKGRTGRARAMPSRTAWT